MKFGILLLVAAVSWGGFAELASARDIFVNNVAGDDRFDGNTPDSRSLGSGPTRTIRRALIAAKTSDRIIIANTGEPYRECISLVGADHSGVPDKQFVIIGNGAVLDGSRQINTTAWRHERGEIFYYEPRDPTHPMLYRDNIPLKYAPPAAGSSIPDLKPLEWTFIDRRLYFRTEAGKIPPDYALTEPGHAVGITIYKAVHIVIDDLTVQGYRLDGIAAADIAQDVDLVGVVARGNGRSGIQVGGASRVDIYASAAYANGEEQIRCEGFSTTRLINCNVGDSSRDADAEGVHRESKQVEIEVINDPAPAGE
ncbi:MAG: right-handed parallel beta-helix repeat-containing protein [bacterium]|nr:right-handed parallel beta-helix repeat-containing protein [bacterium]